jgi:hypothetical protein
MVALRNHGDLDDSEDLNPFVGVESETDDLPAGRVREEWREEALLEVDREISRVEAF